jgi:two-component system chemotaxis response regulator CheB
MNEDGSARSTVRVLVVDDSAFMRSALTRMIVSDSEFEVVGTASCGEDALKKIPALDPDVVTLDVQMPGLDGLATLRYIMHRFPRPVIMVSSATEKDAETTFNALSAGAFDYVPKQLLTTTLEIDHIRCDLIAKIRAAAQSRRVRAAGLLRKPPASVALGVNSANLITPAVIAIGTSTGGPNALEQILPCLAADLPVPILIVQHMPAGFTSSFAQRLNNICAIGVREAMQREVIRPGVAYICPAGVHMRVQRQLGSAHVLIELSASPMDSLHMPSVDILMESVAEVFEDRAVGVIMTGMGSDGAEGMKAIYRAGGLTIGQDEASCAVYGMPRACAEARVLNRVVPLAEIPLQIMQATRRRRPA